MLGSDWDDPRTAALFAAAQQLLGGGGTMERMAGAGSAYTGMLERGKIAQTERERRAQEAALTQMRVAMLRKAQQAEEEAANRRGGFLDAVDPSAGPAMPVSIPAALKAGLSLQEVGALMPAGAAESKIMNLNGTLVEVMPDGKVRELYRAPADPSKGPTAVQEYEYARSQGYKGTFQDWVTEKAKAGATSVGVSYGAPVAAVNDRGQPVFIQPSKDGSPPAVVPGVRPPMSAAEEREAGERKTRERQAQQMVSVLADAESILKKGAATASGLGAARDVALNVVGVSTPAAEDSARLKALSGWLVANVPRMEGPQSNFDVQNYREMAGQVGDSTLPIAQRLAALQQVRMLQQRYAHLNGTPMEESPEGGRVRKYNPETGKIE